MKVSIIVGGRWHAFDLARELQSSGVLHRLITNYPKFKTRQWGIQDNKVVSLPLTLLLSKSLELLGSEKLAMKSQAFLHKLFAQTAVRYLEGSTLVHGWSGFSEPSLHWAKQNCVPFLLERSSAHMKVQCQILREEYQQLGVSWAETHPQIVAQELQEYELAEKIAVPSLFVKHSFLAQGFPVQHLVHNPFGTNLKSFLPGAKHDDIFRVIYAGSLSVRKGIHYLVRAFMKADIPNSELCLVGGATVETPLLLAGADERVKLIGHVPQIQLADYYSNSNIFVMASIEEGMAMVQLQALACGLPLICTTNSGGEDLLRMSGVEPINLDGGIEEYPAGYLVPARNSQAIATCLQILVQDRNLLSSKREAALSFRAKGLDWSSYAQRAIASYKSLHDPKSVKTKIEV